MVFANPSYLWALLGLLVPLAIHLWSKKEAKTIKIGSIQLLDESNSRQSSNIQLNEWFLMLLRMLIITLIVLLMAGPKWRTKGNHGQITYLVEASLANDTSIKSILDSLQEQSTVLYLKEGFPEWELDADFKSEQKPPNYWQLVQQMDSLHSDSIVVFTKALMTGIRSMRPNTKKKIHWVVIEQEELVDSPFGAISNEENIQLLTSTGNGKVARIGKQIVVEGYGANTSGDSLSLLDGNRKSVPLLELKPLTINLYAEEDFGRESQYIEASLRALATFLNREIVLRKKEDINNEIVDLSISLEQDIQYPLEGKWLVFNENPLAKTLIEPSLKKNVFYLTSRLDSKNTVEQFFTEQLLNILNFDESFNNWIAETDIRQLDKTQLEPEYVAPKRKKERATLLDVSHWFFWLLTALICIERLLSKIKKQ
ncbi:MAG: hypothetical protein GYB37_12035 [Algicola sp.]|nr:hypothetical protein [Algicola sp.]